MFQVNLFDGQGWSLVVSFATQEEKSSYMSLIGEDCMIDEVLISESRRDQIIRLGFGSEADPLSKTVQERDISTGMLNPMGRVPASVEFDGRDYKQPSIMGAIIGSILTMSGIFNGDGNTLLQIAGMSITDMPSYLNKILETGGDKIDLLGVCLEVYRALCESNDKVKDALLKTGDAILVYKTKDDTALGVVVDESAKKEKVGQNLLGNALMFLRHELGGSPDPRLGLLRGRKQIKAQDIQPCPEPESENERSWATESAKLLMGRQPSTAKQLEAWTERLNELTDFIIRTGWWPFPEFPESNEQPTKVVMIMDGDKGFMPGPLKSWFGLLMGMVGTPIYSAKKHMMLGDGYLVPHADKLVINGMEFQTLAYDQRDAASWLELSTQRMSDWWGWYLCEQTSKLLPEDQAELVRLLLDNGRMGAQVAVTGPVVTLKQGTEMYTWNFRTRTVSARNGRQYKAFRKAIIDGKPVDTGYILVLLCLKAQSGFKGINGILSGLTNLWEREANYGHAWEENHPTRVIRDNSGAPLKFVTELSPNNPFRITMENAPFSTKLVDKLISSAAYRHDIFVDKNSMKLMAGNGAGAAALTGVWYPDQAHKAFASLDAGVNPLLVLGEVLTEAKLLEYLPKLLAGMPASMVIMEEMGWFVTLNDGAKVTKFLNRAQQGGSWNEAYCWLEWQGKTITRTESAMGVLENKPEGTSAATPEDEAGLLALANANSRKGRKAAALLLT